MSIHQPEECKEEGRGDYCSELSPQRYDSCELSTPAHSASIGALARVTKEVKCLTSDLPCSPGAAIFVRGDRATMTHFQALISGPPDTPYAYGLFLFDINLPSNFPFEPPEFEILTTGNSTLRFNPNLYNTGKVCLSLINTWEGEPDEKWRASCTIVQVLVTIQSLILDRAVAQREPGFEGLTLGSDENLAYSNVVKYGTLLWGMKDMLQRPPLGFERVVQAHFRMTKDLIAREVQGWIAAATDVRALGSVRLASSHNPQTLDLVQRKGIRASLTEAYQQLEEEFARLRD